MAKTKRRSLTGGGADTFFQTGEEIEPLDRETGKQSEGETVLPVIKTSFYPRQDQLDKLDDLAGEYNKKYRRQRKRIDRQDIIRFLIDQCNLDTLSDLQI